MYSSKRLAAATITLALALAACGSGDSSDSAPGDEVPDEIADDVADEVPVDTAGDAGATDQGSSEAGDGVTEPAPAPVAEPGGRPTLDPSCDSIVESDEVVQSFTAPQPFCLDADVDYSATVVTDAGTITIALDQAAAPIAVNNFVGLARNNYFDDTVCHRIIQEFVVQCGDPTATGTGGPGYAFPDELPAAGDYQIGSIAMANSGADTNGSQFFIITGADGVGLAPQYSLFGQVGADDLGVVSEMNARGDLPRSQGIPTQELRIESVEITES